MRKDNQGIAREVLARRKRLLRELQGVQIQLLEVLEEIEQDAAYKADITWVINRRKRRVRLQIRTFEALAASFESSALPIAGAAALASSLAGNVAGVPPTSLLYGIGALLSATSWVVLKVMSLRFKVRADSLKSGVGD